MIRIISLYTSLYDRDSLARASSLRSSVSGGRVAMGPG